MSIGNRLKEERERLGLSQVDFREKCGVTKTAQFYFENDRQMPGGAYLIKAYELGVDIQYVLTGVHGRLETRREEYLLDNYRHSGEEGKQAVEAAAAAVSKQKKVSNG